MERINHCLRKLALGAAVCLLTVSTSMSDDIDVYVAPPPSATVGQTLVIFTLDLRPNVMASSVCTGGECDALFNEVGMGDALDGDISFFELLVAALKKVLFAVDSPDIKVALMVPHADTTGGNKQCIGFQTNDPQQSKRCSNGAYVLSGFKALGDDPDTTSVDESTQVLEFFEKMEALPLKDGGNTPHEYQLKELFFEMFRFASGGHVFNGENGWEDYGTDTSLNLDDEDDTISTHPDHDEGTDPVAELSWDPSAVDPSTKRYINTLDVAEHCSNIYSVNVTFANSTQDADSDDAIALDFPDGFGFNPSNSGAGEEQVLSFLSDIDLDENLTGKQNILSYFVTRAGGAANRANDWAQAGGTGSALVFEDDPEELVRLLQGLFNEIVGVSTTFVAASVPANVFNRAEIRNEVFLAIFEADEDAHPFWVGNVKKLTTKTVEEQVFEDLDGDGVADDPVLVDLDGDGDLEPLTEERPILVDVLEADEDEPNSAINPLDGRIREDALTYWTRTGTNNEYLPPPPADDEEEQLEYDEGTDGRRVARGGAGQVKPGYLDTNEPGALNDDTSDTVLAGPRKLLTEADNDDGSSTGLVNLDADSSEITAVNLLTDSRAYPGTGLTYGDRLFQTVMSDCSSCASSYGSATSTNQSIARARTNNLILHTRGYEFSDVDTATGDKRPWWQADPLHSRPLAVNYGARTGYTQDRPDVRVLVAGNDGLVQMIRDGVLSDGSEDGVEAWAFLPREFLPLQKRLLEGTLGLYNPGVPIAEGEDPRTPLHPYAMDGAPTALLIDNNLDGTINPDPPSEAGSDDGNDRVYLYIGQRRGGKRYYALDISDPDEPKYLWSLGKDDSEFAELAQSWSLVRHGIMQVDEGGTVFNRPVAMFTGGYNGDDGGDGAGDLGKDSRVPNHPGDDATMGTSDDEIVGTNDGEGNALFIVNALTGDLIWKAVGPPATTATGDGVYDSSSQTLLESSMVDSIPSSPTILDSDGNGIIDRIYFPDTGGNIWRVDTASPDRSNWTVTKLFAGGRHFQSDNANDRRFFNRPDVVLASDDLGNFDAVILASGDRPHPLATEVENWIYMIKDRNTTSGVPPTTTLTHDDLANLTNNCLQDDPEDFSACVDAETDAETGEVTLNKLNNGWKVRLQQCEAGDTDLKCGEKVMASPLTIEGTITLTSYLPVLDTISGEETPSTCGTQEGSGLFYALDLQTAAGVLEFDASNNSGGVENPDRFDTLDSHGIPPETVAFGPKLILRPDLAVQKVPGRESGKTFWYERRFR